MKLYEWSGLLTSRVDLFLGLFDGGLLSASFCICMYYVLCTCNHQFIEEEGGALQITMQSTLYLDLVRTGNPHAQ